MTAKCTASEREQVWGFFFRLEAEEYEAKEVNCAHFHNFQTFASLFTQALRVFEDTHLLGRHSREQELKEREEDYR